MMCSIVKASAVFGSSLIRLPHVAATPVRCGHWFTKFYKHKKQQRPLSRQVQKKYNELATEKLPDSKSVPKLLRQYFDDSVPDSVKKIYSFEYLGIESAIEELVRNKVKKLKLHPVEDATAIEIVRLTILLRVQHEQSSVKWNKSMEKKFLSTLDKRDSLVDELRSEDYNKFIELISTLSLNYSHPERPDKFVAKDESESDQNFQLRLSRTRDACQKLKADRLAQLEGKLSSNRAEFVTRKEEKMREAETKLKSIGLQLDTVLNEVYEDRLTDANHSLLIDRLSWYYGEQWALRNAERKLREKEERLASRGRK